MQRYYNMDNPFVFNGYRGKEYFFDREKETQLLLQHALSGVNVTLIAQRRMGKTGLIFRLFDELQTTTANINPIYVDKHRPPIHIHAQRVAPIGGDGPADRHPPAATHLPKHQRERANPRRTATLPGEAGHTHTPCHRRVPANTRL